MRSADRMLLLVVAALSACHSRPAHRERPSPRGRETPRRRRRPIRRRHQRRPSGRRHRQRLVHGRRRPAGRPDCRPWHRPARSPTPRPRLRIDAQGMVVAPGFIDIQSGSYDNLLMGDGRATKQGDPGCHHRDHGRGLHAGALERQPRGLHRVLLRAGGQRQGTGRRSSPRAGPHGFGGWLEAMERHGISVNVGSSSARRRFGPT